MMKILTVTPFFPPDIGGISNHVLNLNINLKKQGVDITVIAPKHLGGKIPTTNNYFKDVFRMNSIYLLGWPYSTLRNFSIPIGFGLKIESIMRNGKFDIVHAQGQHYPITWLAINTAQKYGIPSVLTIHGMYGLNPNVLGGKTRIEEMFNKYVFTKILSKTTAVIGVTKMITDYARKYGKESPKYFTIPNGVNTLVYKDNLHRKKEYRSKYNLGQDHTIILFCGRFEEVKGIIEFAQAAKQIVKNKEIEVIIVGRGPLESYIRSILYGIDRIKILEWQPSEQIHELYIASDIFVIPSKFEGLPIALLEAMNAGLHIVYSPVGGIPEILGGYASTTMLKEVSTNEIQRVLNALISNLPVDKNYASLTYAQRFDWIDIASRTINVYSECSKIV